jgi:hypothetical protein
LHAFLKFLNDGQWSWTQVLVAAAFAACAIAILYFGFGRRSAADRAHRRTLGRDGRRAIRRAAREDRRYRQHDRGA